MDYYLQGQLEVLKKHGIKYTDGDVLWCVYTYNAGLEEIIKNYAPQDAAVRKTNLVFLEKGNDKAGLKHSWIQHGHAYKNICKIDDEKGASEYIKRYMGFGHDATYGFKKDEKRGGFEVVYQANVEEFLVVVFGSNGFIITAYPVNKDMFEKHNY